VVRPSCSVLCMPVSVVLNADQYFSELPRASIDDWLLATITQCVVFVAYYDRLIGYFSSLSVYSVRSGTSII